VDHRRSPWSKTRTSEMNAVAERALPDDEVGSTPLIGRDARDGTATRRVGPSLFGNERSQDLALLARRARATCWTAV